MSTISFDRFSGGLLLERPSSSAPADSLSKAINVDPQPGGWLRSRLSWLRTPADIKINRSYKGLESNGSRLWTFGMGDQTKITGLSPNIGTPLGNDGVLFSAFRNNGTVNPEQSQLKGVARWLDGFVAVQYYPSSITALNFTRYTPSGAYAESRTASDGTRYYTGSIFPGTILSSTDGFTYVPTFIGTGTGTWKLPKTTSKHTFYFNFDGDYGLPGATNAYGFISIGANPFTMIIIGGLAYSIYSVANLNNRHVFVTNNGIYITDNITLKTHTKIDVSTAMVDIVRGFSAFVAVGIGGVCKTSTDNGTTFQTQSTGTTQNLVSIVYGLGIYIAVGAAGIIVTSPDGITWTARASGTTSKINQVEFTGTGFAAVTDSGLIIASNDGITWTTLFTAVSGTVGSVPYGALHGISYGPSGLSAYGGIPLANSANIYLSAASGSFNTLYTPTPEANTVTVTPITDVNMPKSGKMAVIKQRIFAISDDGLTVKYCKLADPLDWTSIINKVDAGFLPVSQHFASGQKAYALGAYQGKLAVFTDTSIQIWTIDPDNTAMALDNVVDGIGTRHHSSVVSLQGDLLFLSDTGIRSLTTLQNSLFPSDVDIGLPVKKIAQSPLQTDITVAGYESPIIIGLSATPLSQYWVGSPTWDVDSSAIVKPGWLAWSYSRQANLNAWSAHTCSYKINSWSVLGRRIYMRSEADDYLMVMEPGIYTAEQVGGLSAPFTLDIETQWLNFARPGVRKVLNGFDFDGVNVSSIEVFSSFGGNRQGVSLGSIAISSAQGGWTYSGGFIPFVGDGTEFKIRFVGGLGAEVQITKLTIYYDEAGLS